MVARFVWSYVFFVSRPPGTNVPSSRVTVFALQDHEGSMSVIVEKLCEKYRKEWATGLARISVDII